MFIKMRAPSTIPLLLVSLLLLQVQPLAVPQADGQTTTTGSGDPRCPADFDPLVSCPSSMILPGGAGFDLTRNIDPTTCNDQENCPQCLGDDVWQQKLRDEVGLYSAIRDIDFKPWVLVDNWLSHEIVSTLTMILLRDAMNISARAAAKGVDGTLEQICCTETLLGMEQWGSGVLLEDTVENTITAKAIGYSGESGLFIPPYTAEKYPLAFSYHAYGIVDQYKTIFLPSFSTDCSNMTVDEAAGCNAGNYVCETNAWTNTTCYDGKWYVPPQCDVAGEVGNPSTTKCQEVLMADPTYDSGVFEAMIKNNGLNMTGAYLGVTRHNAMVRDLVARKVDFMFYWYEPDPLIAEIGAQKVIFDASTPECESQRYPDPTLSTASCGYPTVTLQKRVRSSARESDADFKHFFDTFSLTRGEIDVLLSAHTSAGGNSSVYDLSCNWIKGNFDTWKDFVQNTPPSSSFEDSSHSDLSDPGIVAAIVVSCVVVVLLVTGLLFWIGCRHRLSLRRAPTTAPLALVFTDIENSTMLWEACGDDMGRAVEIHHSIIRKHIEEYGAYEVKTIGDSFMIACSSLGDATLMCLAIQTSLGECETFPPALRFIPKYKQDEEEKRRKSEVASVRTMGGSMRLFGDVEAVAERERASSPVDELDDHEVHSPFHNPLRIRIGLHWCQEVNPTIDRMYGRYDYYGHDVNVCARVEAQGSGGQIMVTSDTMERIMQTDVYPLMIAPYATSAVFKRNVELKGVSGVCVLHVLAPNSQVDSGYVVSNLMKSMCERRRSTSRHRSVVALLGGSGTQNGSMMWASDISPNFSDHKLQNQQFIVCRNYTTSLFRSSFRAVPEEGKGVWLASMAKLLRVYLQEEDTSDGRLQYAKQFELIKAAVEANCLQSVTATTANFEPSEYSLNEEKKLTPVSSETDEQHPLAVVAAEDTNAPLAPVP